jgi:hypothetical protein
VAALQRTLALDRALLLTMGSRIRKMERLHIQSIAKKGRPRQPKPSGAERPTPLRTGADALREVVRGLRGPRRGHSELLARTLASRVAQGNHSIRVAVLMGREADSVGAWTRLRSCFRPIARLAGARPNKKVLTDS